MQATKLQCGSVDRRLLRVSTSSRENSQGISYSLVREGVGWDTTEGKQWFSQNPPECRRRAATSREISEDRLITRTMMHIRFTDGQSGEKIYEFRCDDMKKLVEGNTSLNARHKKLLQTKTFPCSQDFVMSLPFDDIKKWRQGNWTPLKQYVAPSPTFNFGGRMR